MWNGVWADVLAKGTGQVPQPLPKSAWVELYQQFTAFAEFVSAHPELSDTFDVTAKEWQAESGFRSHFSGYFSPYYRNRAGESSRDNKIIFQFCEPYYRYLSEREPELFALPPFRNLVDGLMAALFSAFATYLPLVNALRDIDPALAHRLLPIARVAPVSIRLLRYYSDKKFFTNPHVDKSAITVILDTDEPIDQPCLVFAPRSDGSAPRLSQFAPVPHREHESLVFFGAAPQQAGHTAFSPAAHAVKPLTTSQVRHVAIFFWLLPGIDLAMFDTTTPFLDDLNLARSNKRRYG